MKKIIAGLYNYQINDSYARVSKVKGGWDVDFTDPKIPSHLCNRDCVTHGATVKTLNDAKRLCDNLAMQCG